MTTYTIASARDLEGVIQLLSQNELPTSDVPNHIDNFIIAKKGDQIVGSIGVEQFGTEALLRSLAVSEEARNREIGKALYSKLISVSKERGIKRFHLLTTTAEQYFKKLDFAIEDRERAPDSIKNTLEFSSLCPSSSTYMVKNIDS